jgi:DASS family divalent anion:Na+ symporter
VTSAPAAPEAAGLRPRFERSQLAGLAACLAIYALVGHVLPAPPDVSPSGWRITGVFLATIAGLMLRPLPGAVVVLLGICGLGLVGNLTMGQALAGFASPSAWLVVTAMLMSRALRDTGVARRIALLFVRTVGGTSLGVSYALVMTDVVLAGSIPTITARNAGIVLPVGLAISELYGSTPGATARRLGAFLIAAMYQASVVACAMYITGQASNLLAAAFAAKLAGVSVTWVSWFVAGLVPGVASCMAIPYVVYRLLPPEIKRTPAAAKYARDELAAMGPLTGVELFVIGVVSTVCLLWMTSGWHGLDVTLVSLVGIGVMIVSRVLPWERVLAEHTAWDVFVWYGGLITLGELLNATGSTKAFATSLGAAFEGWSWFAILLATIAVYFYAHYGFASITTHVLAMFPPFVVMLVGAGTPPGLAVYALACLANLTAGLTHYGTTTGPILFAQGYVSFRDWWWVGLLGSIVNLAIWLTLGFAWWKLIGIW